MTNKQPKTGEVMDEAEQEFKSSMNALVCEENFSVHVAFQSTHLHK